MCIYENKCLKYTSKNHRIQEILYQSTYAQRRAFLKYFSLRAIISIWVPKKRANLPSALILHGVNNCCLNLCNFYT